MEARLQSATDIVGFRMEARQLLAHQIPPEDVTWTAPPEGEYPGQALAAAVTRSRASTRAATSIVPASFVRLCEYVVQHRDPERFALLYRLLWRLVHEPQLRHDPGDRDMARAQHMAHAVRRDIHKLKMNVRFREMEDPCAPGETIHIAYIEPAHHVLEATAPWLAKRYADMRWAVITPERSAYWDRKRLHYGPSGAVPLTSHSPDGEWLARWQSLYQGLEHRPDAG